MHAPKLQPIRNMDPSEEPRDIVSVRRPSTLPASPVSLLVVDSDAQSRAVLAEMLRQQGYEVTCACSVAEATAWLVQRQFGIMVCELLIPGQNGSELMVQAIEQDPEMAVIVIGEGEP